MTKQPDNWQQHMANNILPRMEATEQATGFPPAPANPQPFSAGISLTPTFDVIDALPEERKDLLRKLRQHSDDRHAIIPPGETVREASMAKIDAANSLKRLTDHPQDFGRGLPETDPLAVAAQKHLDKMTADFERLKQLQEVRSAAWQSASQAKAACETWLRSGVPGGCKLEAVEVEPPKMLKGETVLEAIERLRRRGRELRADQHRIASAPYPSSYCKQRMRAQIEALAMQGAPSVSRLVELDGKIDFATQRITSEVHADRRGLAFTEVPDTVGLVAWLHKDALIAALDREIASEADDKAALTHEARQKAEAEVMGDLLDVERQEAALTWLAQSQALPVEFRSDCSPLAILQVQLITVPRTTEPPGTSSPGMSWDLRR